MKKWQVIFFKISVLLCLILCFAGCGRSKVDFVLENDRQDEASETEETDREAADQEASVTAKPTVEATPVPAVIYVDVCGAVANPGVYSLKADSRVFQAIEAAGGYSEQAAEGYVNRAQPLSDGQQIYVPTEEETKGEVPGAVQQEAGALPEGASDQDSSSGKVNLNTADIEQITTLTGIGESKARDILAYREENGGFSSIEEIMNVQGIKEGTFEKIKDEIAVE